MAAAKEAEDKESAKHAIIPPSRRALTIEIEGFETAIILTKKLIAGVRGGRVIKDDTAIMWMEIASRKDLFRIGTGIGYEPPLELNKMEKTCLIKMFNSLSGHEWTKKFGWIGQVKTLTKPEIRVFDPMGSLFEGVSSVKLLATAMVSGIDLSGNYFHTKLTQHY